MGIEITSQPSKTRYVIGEAFDATGLVVSAVFDDNSKENLSPADYTLSGFDSDVAGLKTVLVTYLDKTASFDVNVVEATALRIVSLPDKLNYVAGEELDLEGLEVELVYSDDETVAVNVADLEVSGYDSALEENQTVILSYQGFTAEFEVDVWAADWSAEDLYYMDYFLLYNFPYYMSFVFDMDGMQLQSGEEIRWFYAATDFVASDDDFDAYLDLVESIETADGERAWLDYKTYKNGGTYDIDYLGYAADSEVYQYARWYNDNDSYFAYQILTVGLDDAGCLLVTTTICQNVFASSGVGVGSYWICYYDDADEGLIDLVTDQWAYLIYYGLYLTYDATSLSEPPVDQIIYPNYTEDTYLYIRSDSYNYPYFYGSMYSDIYDATNIYYSFESEVGFTQADLDSIKAEYEARGYYVEEPAPADGSFTVLIEGDGYYFAIDYEYDPDYASIDMYFYGIGYELPFRGDFILSSVYDELAGHYYLYTGSFTPVSDFETADFVAYDDDYFAGYTLAPFYSPDDIQDIEEDFALACEAAGWVDSADDIDWYEVYSIDIVLTYLNEDKDPLELTLDIYEDGCTDTQDRFIYSEGTDIAIMTFDYETGRASFSFNIEGVGSSNRTFYPSEEGMTVAGQWWDTDVEASVSITLDVSDIYVSNARTWFYVANPSADNDVSEINIEIVNYGSLCAVYFEIYDRIVYEYEDWADAQAALNAFVDGATPFPDDFASDATSFILDQLNYVLVVNYEDADAAANNTIGADLVAGGFVAQNDGQLINGVAYFSDEYGAYYLAVSVQGNQVFVQFIEYDEVLSFEDLYVNAAKALGCSVDYALNFLNATSASAVNMTLDQENGHVTFEIVCRDNSMATSLRAGNELSAQNHGFAYVTDEASPYYHTYAKVNAIEDYSISYTVEDNVLTIDVYYVNHNVQ